MSQPGMNNTEVGSVRIEHEFGYFLDQSKYEAIKNYDDESIAVLKLSLIIENYLSVLINNLRRKGTERFVKEGRYFAPKLDLSVVLGLPVSLADVMLEINSIRNKFAHHIEHEIDDKEIEGLLRKLSEVKIEEVNHFSYFKEDMIGFFFESGIDCVSFVKNAFYTTSKKKMRVFKLVAATYVLLNFATFYLINEMSGRGILKITPVNK
ncbi:Uncharacterised protein [Serratia marcescens]|uniref:hypothetical protein n=1 Tax=Serratia marcescens TaxID=615 RepID=UPI0007453BEE|nr:hypothetical protein [Serratia marcescens]CUZ74604.1 Uncharacterised protein [Serratia marcescens]HEJ7815270.1 hypothetical protein [Serratia marcescens]